MIKEKKMIKYGIILGMAVLLSACGAINRNVSGYMNKTDNAYQNSPEGKPLEVPADLNGEAIRDHYLVPVAAGQGPDVAPSLMAPDSPAQEMATTKHH